MRGKKDMSRVSKKISVLDSVDPNASILVLNLYDPQINTFKAMLHYVEEKNLPYFIVANKCDKVEEDKIAEITSLFEGHPIIIASMLESKGTNEIKKEIRKRFEPDHRVVVLGIFNSGKSSLIKQLTNNHEIFVSDMPGSTLSFLEYNYGRSMKLIDSVGQIIDVNKPLMVSVDLDDCKTTDEKLRKVMLEDAYGIMNSIEYAIPGLVKAVEAIQAALKKDKKIIVTGAGASALVGMELAGQGYETGLPVYSYTNNLADANPVSFAKGLGENEGGISRYIAGTINAGDVVIAISASGGTGFVYDVLSRGKEKGATTIAITENPDTPMGRYSDIIIKSNAKPEGPSSSKIQAAHLAIAHALAVTLASERNIDAETSIQYMLPEFIPTKKMGIK
jgi:D-arabinose 5-phosphate isomerase GutQ/GTP-binding protein EngB required for normal cell division